MIWAIREINVTRKEKLRNIFASRFYTHHAVLPIYPAVLLILVYQDVFIDGSAIFTHDSIHWYGNFNYFVLCLVNGDLPLWDPFAFSGAPYYLNHNIVGALDPTLLIAIPFIKLANFSVLDFYHIHFLLRLLIFYGGAYALYRYVSRNDWAALLGATVLLFVMAPNSFWQHGSTLIVSYVPLIMLFLLKLFSPETPDRDKGLLFLATCYLVGLSFNLYLPSYLFIFLSLSLLYLWISRAVSFQDLKNILSNIGMVKLVWGFLILIIMTGPFFYSLSKLLRERGESFSYTRFEESPRSEFKVHAEALHQTKSSSQSRATHHNLISILFPGGDQRFFSPDRLPIHENFLSFGFIPVILVALFAWSSKSPYKGLFIFLSVILALYYGGPDPIFKKFLQYYPGAQSIRQFHNFMGFFLLSGCALVAICFSRVMDISFSDKPSSKFYLPYFFLIGIVHIAILYYYLLSSQSALLKELRSDMYLELTQNAILNNGWFYCISYVLIGLFLISKTCGLRKILAAGLAMGTIFYLVNFNFQLRPLVTQPGQGARSGYIHYPRNFVYNPIRIPFVPRHSNLWGFLPALYRIPASVPTYHNTYMSLNRRPFDYLRFTSADRQRIIGGVGAMRYGFFDEYVLAKDSVHALDLVGRMSLTDLRKTIVLEEDPIKFNPESRSLQKIESESLLLDDLVNFGSFHKMSEFYDESFEIKYDSGSIEENGFLKIKIDPEDNILQWPWDRSHIGYFHMMLGEIKHSLDYYIMRYFPNPGIQVDYKDDQFCYIDFPEWLQKHALPKYYKFVYDQAPYLCDIYRDGNNLLISPELQGAFVTDDIAGQGRDEPITSFSLVALDPKKIYGNQSLYPRDEDVVVEQFGPNMISFKINNSKDGFFYYADSTAEDWRGYLNNQPAKIYTANFNFKALYIPAGTHTLTLEFRPLLYIFLLWLFIIASIPGMYLPIAALVSGHKRKKNKTYSDSSGQPFAVEN